MYRNKLRIGSSAVGRDGRLRITNAVDVMQDCACFHLEDNPVLSRYFREEHCGMYLIYRQVEIVSRPYYNEKITVETATFQCNRAMGSRNTRLLDSEGKVAFIDYEIGAFVDLNRAAMIRAPQEVVDAIPMEPPMEMERLPRKIQLPSGEGKKGSAFTVPRCYIDNFGHMNNSKYIEVTEPLLPHDFEIARIRLDFRTALLEGETVTPYIYDQGNTVTVALMGEDDSHSKAIIEFRSKSSQSK